MPAARRLPLIVLGVGTVLALAAQLAAPVRVPLYDGVVVQEPYRYLSPGPGQPGFPVSFASEPGLEGGASRAFDAATAENPPQAQLIALPGSFVVAAGATTLKVSITPVATTVRPAAGDIAGNVYRFSVTDGSGAPLAIAASNPPTLTLRAPEGISDALIGRLGATGWQLLSTEHGGSVALFSTNPTELGDFAVITTAGGPPFGLIVPVILVLAALAAVWISVVGRRRRQKARLDEAARPRPRSGRPASSSRRRRRP